MPPVHLVMLCWSNEVMHVKILVEHMLRMQVAPQYPVWGWIPDLCHADYNSISLKATSLKQTKELLSKLIRIPQAQEILESTH